MICPKCKKEVNEGEQFCGECGFNLSKNPKADKKKEEFTMNCPKCGSTIKGNGSFCGSCGVRLSEEVTMDKKFSIPSNKRFGWIAGIGVIVVIAVVFIVVKKLSKPYMEPFNEFMELVNDRESDEAEYRKCFAPDVLDDYIEYNCHQDDYEHGVDYVDESEYNQFVKRWEDIFGDDYELTIEFDSVKHASKRQIEKQQRYWSKKYKKQYKYAKEDVERAENDSDSDFDSGYYTYLENQKKYLKDARDIEIVDAYLIKGITFYIDGSKKSDDIFEDGDDVNCYVYKTSDGDWFTQWGDFNQGFKSYK